MRPVNLQWFQPHIFPREHPRYSISILISCETEQFRPRPAVYVRQDQICEISGTPRLLTSYVNRSRVNVGRLSENISERSLRLFTYDVYRNTVPTSLKSVISVNQDFGKMSPSHQSFTLSDRCLLLHLSVT